VDIVGLGVSVSSVINLSMWNRMREIPPLLLEQVVTIRVVLPGFKLKENKKSEIRDEFNNISEIMHCILHLFLLCKKSD